MELSFDVNTACKVGPEAAVVLRYIEDGEKLSKRLERFGECATGFIFKDGRIWTEGRASVMTSILSFLSEEEIEEALTKLTDEEYLEEGEFLNHGHHCYAIKEEDNG